MSWEMTVLTLSYREPRNVQFIILFFNILQPAASRLTTKISHHRFNALIVVKNVFFFLRKNTPRIVGGHRIMNIKYQVLTNYGLSILIILWLHRQGNFSNYNHFRSDFFKHTLLNNLNYKVELAWVYSCQVNRKHQITSLYNWKFLTLIFFSVWK